MADASRFEKLQTIVFKDLEVEGYSLRFLGLTAIEPDRNWDIKPHTHSFFEFNYVTEGVSNTAINGVEYAVGPRQFFLLPPGTLHSHRPGSHLGVGLRWEMRADAPSRESAHASTLRRLIRRAASAVPAPLSDTDGSVGAALERLLDTPGGASFRLAGQMNFFLLILRIFEVLPAEDGEPVSSPTARHVEHHITSNAIRFIEENYWRDLDAVDVANFVHVSYSHLARLFQRYQKTTIKSLLNDLRLRKAQQLLACTEKSIAEISQEVGFTSGNYFSSVFKSRYGQSPGQFRATTTRLSE